MSGPTLLAIKRVPPLRRGLMHRRRLVQALDGAARHRLTLLMAPAGWGKTSLLADWHTTGRRQRVGWLALDPEDSDPVRFWTYLISAVRTVLPGVGERALATLGIPGRARYDAALPALINDLAALDEHVHRVLDNYQVLTDPELHRTVAYLLAHQPPRLHLIIATRRDPPVPFGRLRAHGEMLEIRANDLAFTDSEATTMLNGALALGLDVQDVQRLAARTEGWAAGLYLAGLSLRERPDRAVFVAAFHGTDRFVLDFLGSEVLAAQPVDLRTFLLETSILPRLSASLCQTVTCWADSAALLERIERSNLFLVPPDSEGHWFRYHRLHRNQRGCMPFKDHQPAPAASSTDTNLEAEAELIEALRRRDDNAYRTLVRRYTPLMLRLARQHVPSQAIAEEVVQDSWVAVLRGIDAFQGRCQFGTWLMRILLNTARKRGVREHTPARWDALAVSSTPAEPVQPTELNPEAVVLATETRTLLEQAIRALPERQRAVLVLRDVDGWPADEVCTALEVSTGNQRVLLHRARAAVRATLHSRRHDLVPA